MKKLRYFCETALVAAAAWLLPRLPRALILGLARAIGTAAYHLDRRGRTTALENLRVALGIEGPRAAALARGSYQNFARTFLDLFWSARLTRDNWPQFVTIHHGAEAAEARAREVGALWVTPHFGNFELASLFWGFRDFQFTVVAQDFKNPALTGLFKRLREHSGHTVITQQGAMLRLMKTLKRRGHAALLTDLTVDPGRTAAAIDCFGLKTCVTTLHVQLARRLGLAIIPGVCLPLPDGRYEVHIFEAIEPQPEQSDHEVAQRVWDHFERAIREHPQAWLWMYKHWRYQPALGRNPAYPAYARVSGAFLDLLKAQA